MQVEQRRQLARFLRPVSGRHRRSLLLRYGRHRGAPFWAGALTTFRGTGLLRTVSFLITRAFDPSPSASFFAATSFTGFAGNGLYPLNISNCTAPGASNCAAV